VAANQRPRVSRAKAQRLLRPYLVPIAAIALAADRAATASSDATFVNGTKNRYRSKTEGNNTAVLWAEGVRQWVLATAPPNLRVYEPFRWTELLVGDVLHVRIQRDRQRPLTPRRASRQAQIADTMLPSFMDEVEVTTLMSMRCCR